MDKRSTRESDVNRILWGVYHPRRISRKMTILLGVVGAGAFGVVYGFENLVAAAVGLSLLAISAAFGYWVGIDRGKYEGEIAERKRMLDEGYSLDSKDLQEEDDGVTPLRTCKWCGHITDEGGRRE